jgi:hypothetical protein
MSRLTSMHDTVDLWKQKSRPARCHVYALSVKVLPVIGLLEFDMFRTFLYYMFTHNLSMQ